ncbi:hypothetical protein QYF36_022507 [Acer negundo]|nr:hypothetical protein QYF36_022507 [Acer negundo]
MIFNLLSELAQLIFGFWSWWCDGLAENPNSRVIPTLVAATLLAISLYAWLINKPFTSVPPLPPGPPGLPLLGNLPFLEPDLHRYFAKLAEIYGLIMKLQLVAAKASTYGGVDILWNPSDPEWRKLRQIWFRK